MKNETLELFKIVDLRIITDLGDNKTRIEGRAICGCCYRFLKVKEARKVIERLLEEKKCDIEYLEVQKKIVLKLVKMEEKE